ncbi:MAG: hypothetical protein ACK5M7_20505 [Draconibacterium sp.]
MTDQEIIDRNCGVPPQREKLEYTIWLNEMKAAFYEKSRSGVHRPPWHKRS